MRGGGGEVQWVPGAGDCLQTAVLTSQVCRVDGDVRCMMYNACSLSFLRVRCWCIRGKIIIRNQFIPGWWLSMRKRGQLLLSPSSFHPAVSVTKLVED